MVLALLFVRELVKIVKPISAKNTLVSNITNLLPRNMVCRKYSVLHGNKTIYSVSSGIGKAGVAVIRISGANSAEVFRKIAKIKMIPESRKCVLRRLYDPESGDFLDRALVLWFKGPGSFTGEDCCELHIHGGLAVTSAVLAALSKLPHFAQSEPGEFTKRAFLNGKCDLTAVEGMADLINAETEAQRKQALRQMDGELHKLYSGWRQIILRAVAHVEAFIDFGDDEIIEVEVLNKVDVQIKQLIEEIEHHMRDNRRGERLRSGVHVAILGSPNVGKSSLLNYLGQKPAAIVSPVAGTTRDVIEIAANIGGYPILLSDTAGLHDSSDAVELEGINRAIKKAKEADLIILMLDSNQLKNDNPINMERLVTTSLNEWGLNDLLGQHEAKRSTGASEHDNEVVSAPSFAPKILVAVNKIDLCGNEGFSFDESSPGSRMTAISCLTGQGMKNFMDTLTKEVKSLCEGSSGEHPSLTQVRHRNHLVKCNQRLRWYFDKRDQDLALATNELHKAARQLGEISGVITTEQILDVIFKDFCIGK